MSTLKRYKDMEKRLYRKGAYAASETGKGIGRLFHTFIRSGRQKMTIMLVPHSERRALNLQVSRFALAGLLLLLGAGFSFLLFSVMNFGGASRQLSRKSADLQLNQDNLDSIRDETARLMKAARKFESTLSETLGAVGLEGERKPGQAGSGDLASFFNTSESRQGSLQEVSQLQEMTDYFERSVEQVKLLGQLYGSKNALNSIPTAWPIKSGIGVISMYYGQNKNPFTNMWYIHKGLDINTRGAGDPVCATADGEVIQVAYQEAYGNYITVKHQFGFYTRYAHLQSTRVLKGQKVQQGQVVGYLGNTGLSTGPHLHYEIHLGTEVVDPLKFLNRPKPAADAPAGNL